MSAARALARRVVPRSIRVSLRRVGIEWNFCVAGGSSPEPRDRLAGEAAVFRDWLLAPEPVDAQLAIRARHWAAALSSCGPIER